MRLLPSSSIVIFAVCFAVVLLVMSGSAETHRHVDFQTQLFALNASKRPQNEAVTALTHMTIDRLPLLVRLCKVWRGPISVSLFLRANEDLQSFLASWTDDCIVKNCDLHVVRRLPGTGRQDTTSMYVQYPFNVQRNAALDGARTTWVLLLDIDFFLFPDSEAKERKLRPHLVEWENFAKKDKPNSPIAFVVPAVETVSVDVTPASTKPALLASLRGREAVAFYGHHCRDCHHPTNVELFAQSPQPYSVTYVEGYEPYVIARRELLPRYDERFVGRGWSKMSYFYELDRLGWKFIVQPHIFLVHLGRGDVPSGGANDEIYRQHLQSNRALWEQFKEERKVTESSSEVDDLSSSVWATIASSTLGKSTSCVSVVREPTREQVAILRDMIHQACSIEGVDCSPIRGEGIRNQSSVVFQADWAFDRAYQEMMQADVGSRMACDFGGMGNEVRCPKTRLCCQPTPSATDGALGTALGWLCGPHQLQDCPSLLKRIAPADATFREIVAYAMSFYVMMQPCSTDVEESCNFRGNAQPVPCTALRPRAAETGEPAEPKEPTEKKEDL